MRLLSLKVTWEEGVRRACKLEAPNFSRIPVTSSDFLPRKLAHKERSLFLFSRHPTMWSSSGERSTAGKPVARRIRGVINGGGARALRIEL